jgi:hypothetical protein
VGGFYLLADQQDARRTKGETLTVIRYDILVQLISALVLLRFHSLFCFSCRQQGKSLVDQRGNGAESLRAASMIANVGGVALLDMESFSLRFTSLGSIVSRMLDGLGFWRLVDRDTHLFELLCLYPYNRYH